jgi:hypothetical protein
MTSMIGSTGMRDKAQQLRGGSPQFAGDKLPSGYKARQLQQFTPEQMNLFQQSMNHVGPDSYTSRLASGDQSLFAEMEAPAMRQFQELQGQNASRFSGMGLGARRGSGFQNQMSADTSNFAQDLASKRQGLMRQAVMDLHGMSQNLLNQRPYERFLEQKPQDQGFNWGGLAGGVAGGIGGFFMGNPIGGAMAGYGIGSGLSGYGAGGTENVNLSQFQGIGGYRGNQTQSINPNISQMARGTY